VKPIVPLMETVRHLQQASEPWVRLAAARFCQDLASIPHLMVETASHPLIQTILDDCASWPHYTLQRHNDARHAFHKIGFLIDIGLDKTIPQVQTFCDRVLQHQSEDGSFLCETFIPKSFRGSGQAEWMWISCDAPLLLHALLTLGYGDDPRVIKAAEHLQALVEANGWGCRSSNPGFRGPGKKEEPCPIVNVMALKALSLIPTASESSACRKGTEMLLGLWETRSRQKYYLFAMGSDFQKLKYPLFWFDLLNVVDTLSRFPWVYDDPRFLEMVDRVVSKVDAMGMVKPESVWMAFKGFDFAQKKTPSPTLTLAIMRLLSRLKNGSDSLHC